jgi:uncharacterized protein YecT (DUF1311 family)
MTDIERFLMSLREYKDADGKLNPIYLADTIQEEIEIIQRAIKHSQRWVGLTDEEMEGLYESATYMDKTDCIHLLTLAADTLKEKNT